MPFPSYTNKFGVRVEVPYSVKERPRCRKYIEQMCREAGLTVVEMMEQLQRDHHVMLPDQDGRLRPCILIDNMRKQLRKMVYEYWRERESEGTLTVPRRPAR
jgi:hypothetical protein